jgi:hypothetical protein
MTGDALRWEADQHDRNASIILSVQLPSYEDLECAAREVEQAKDKRSASEARHPELRKAIRRFKARFANGCLTDKPKLSIATSSKARL